MRVRRAYWCGSGTGPVEILRKFIGAPALARSLGYGLLGRPGSTNSLMNARAELRRGPASWKLGDRLLLHRMDSVRRNFGERNKKAPRKAGLHTRGSISGRQSPIALRPLRLASLFQPLMRAEGLGVIDASIRPSRKNRRGEPFAGRQLDVVVGIIAKVGNDIRAGAEPVG